MVEMNAEKQIFSMHIEPLFSRFKIFPFPFHENKNSILQLISMLMLFFPFSCVVDKENGL